ncbi:MULTISPECIES: universal stress protein [Marinovum]|jgi:nucleotide-binding universal stress UspA family protein|uniref:universal stress protein n=1 Tax=Marinovum TaxID=367771 RepID=UPI00065B1089|nr:MULTISPECIES: universal stress protein [Marinovum]AKO96005.1 Universal stress protein UspA [Marinovum algicola DG 898]MDD9741005.1 universal stress protein [Marinovum sp. SP66]
MYNKILVAMALDHGISPQMLEIAQALCNPGAEIVALHVFEAPPSSVSAYLGDDAVRDGFDRARQLMAEKTAHIEGITARIVRGHTYRTLIDYSADHGVDCIVIGSHQPDFSDYLLGSTAARVVRHAPCAVHVFRSS